MPGPWVQFADLQQALADVLKKDTIELEDYWNRICTQVLIDSTAYITTLMQGKAFTVQQLDAWDFNLVFQRDYSLFLALVKGGAAGDIEPSILNQLNRAPELKGMTSLSIGGVLQPPGASDGAGIESGSIEHGSIHDFDRRARHNLKQWASRRGEPY